VTHKCLKAGWLATVRRRHQRIAEQRNDSGLQRSISRLVRCAHSLLAQLAAQRLAQLGDCLLRLVVDGLIRQAPSTVTLIVKLGVTWSLCPPLSCRR
jgi:hypothetical protein